MKRFTIILTAALAVSCSEFQNEQQFPERQMTVGASAPATKTSIAASVIGFTDGDQMTLVCEGYNRLTVSNAGTGNVNKFTGKYRAFGIDGADCEWYSAYPSTLTISELGVISGHIPQTQTAPFDLSANLMYSDIVMADYNEASPPAISLNMNQMLGIIGITFSNSNASYADDVLQTVQLRTSSSLAGDITFDIHDPGVSLTGNSRKNVVSHFVTEELLGKDVEHTVYLFVNPVSISNASLLIRTDKHTFSYISSQTFTPSAGALTSFQTFDLSSFSVEGPTSLKKRVVCWGDSYTHGVYTYTENLQRLLGDDWEVYDGGISGDRTYEIASRQGGLPMVTASAFTLPAGTEKITIDGVLRTHNVPGEAGYYNIRHFGGRLTNPCKLIGTEGEEVLCNISGSSKTVDEVTTYSTTINRLTAGEPVEIAEHTPIETYAARELRNVDLTIIYMGANGMYGDEGNTGATVASLTNLVQQHREMVDFTTHSSDYLILGFHNRKEFENANYSALFEAEFGADRFINLRKPVVKDEASCNYWLLRSGTFAKEEDIPATEWETASKGNWPRSLFYDATHPNGYGSEVFALLIYDRMAELGYLDN